MTLDTKFCILDSLATGGSQLRDTNSRHLGQYLSMSVSGLCHGGGGTWSRVKVSGLETSLLTQTLMGVTSLVRLGENTVTWHQQIRHIIKIIVFSIST